MAAFPSQDVLYMESINLKQLQDISYPSNKNFQTFKQVLVECSGKKIQAIFGGDQIAVSLLQLSTVSDPLERSY